jgi:hypothetical protein
MPIKSFFLPLLLAPTHSPYYPFLYTTHKRPLSSYATSMLLNCTSLNPSPEPTTCTVPFSDPSSGIMLNYMFLIPVSWITHSSNPPHHSSCIAFIEYTDNTQHKVTCPTLQMYLCDGSCRGPDGLVACAPTCYTNAPLESDPSETHAPLLYHVTPSLLVTQVRLPLTGIP